MDVGSRVGSGRDACHDMTAILKRNMATGALRRVEIGMPVIAGHCMPERAKSRSECGHDEFLSRAISPDLCASEAEKSVEKGGIGMSLLARNFKASPCCLKREYEKRHETREWLARPVLANKNPLPARVHVAPG